MKMNESKNTRPQHKEDSEKKEEIPEHCAFLVKHLLLCIIDQKKKAGATCLNLVAID